MTSWRRESAGAGQDVEILLRACARVGLGRSEPWRELDVGRVEVGLPRPLGRGGCYQQIDRHKMSDGWRRPGICGEHPCPYYTHVVWRRPLSDLGDQRQDQRPALGLLVEEA